MARARLAAARGPKEYRPGANLLPVLMPVLVFSALAFCMPADLHPSPASSTSATASAAPASAAGQTASPCQAALKAIRPGTVDPGTFLAAAACLRDAEPTPLWRRSPQNALSAGDSALKHLLPAADGWYVTHLERFRARRDMARLSDMAWLAVLKNPSGPDVWREIAEAFSLAGDPLQTAYAHLKQAERDSAQSGYIQYQLENLLRSLADLPAPALLDSITALYRHTKPVTAEILESLSWSHRHLPSAYPNTLAYLALKHPGPAVVLERAGRYHAAGYWDYASGILEKSGWRKFPKPWQAMARTQYLRVRFQMEDWTAIAAEIESATAAKAALSEEEIYIASAAALRLGKAQAALARLERLTTSEESPWGYRARLLKAQALISLGRLQEAGKTLDALKRSPRRREGSGPILFWQGWLALQQGRVAPAESLLVLSSAYTGNEESQRALEYRYWLLLDSGAARTEFFRGLPESPLTAEERLLSLDRVSSHSPLWPYAGLEKAQILATQGRKDSARAILDEVSKLSRDRLPGLRAEAMSAFLQENTPGGRAAALARYEDLLIKYQQGVVPEFSRGRLRALK